MGEGCARCGAPGCCEEGTDRAEAEVETAVRLTRVAAIHKQIAVRSIAAARGGFDDEPLASPHETHFGRFFTDSTWHGDGRGLLRRKRCDKADRRALVAFDRRDKA